MNKVIIKKFLSKIADQYGKNAFYIRNFSKSYEEVFKKVPSYLLDAYFDDYWENHAPQFIPTLPQIKEFVRSRPQARDEWFLTDRGVYCLNCRTDEDGKEGGIRVIWARFYSPKQKRDINITTSARCCCSASMGSGRMWNEVVEDIKKIDSKAAIRHDFYDHEKGTRVRASYQGDALWKHRIKKGYVIIEEDSDDGVRYYKPVWDHPYWPTSMGHYTAKLIGWDVPEEVQERRAKVRAKNQRANSFESAVTKLFKAYSY